MSQNDTLWTASRCFFISPSDLKDFGPPARARANAKMHQDLKDFGPPAPIKNVNMHQECCVHAEQRVTGCIDDELRSQRVAWERPEARTHAGSGVGATRGAHACREWRGSDQRRARMQRVAWERPEARTHAGSGAGATDAHTEVQRRVSMHKSCAC
eukprot:366345-Chlamydomonas_euryale.AAC.12